MGHFYFGQTGQFSTGVDKECAGVSISAEVELVSGLWGGALVRVQWSAQGTGGTSANVDVFLANALSETPGLRQVIEIDAIKPVGYVPGSSPGQIRVIAYGTSNTDGSARTQNVTRYHRFGVRALSQSASAYIDQKAIADLQGNAQASMVMRARAGGAVGEIEIVAADNPVSGPASVVTINSDRFQFVGDLAVFLGAVKISGDLIVKGAVSSQGFFWRSSSVVVNGIGSANQADVFGAPQAVAFAAYDLPIFPDNPVIMTVNGVATASTVAPAWLRLRLQGYTGGAWYDLSLRLQSDVFLYDGRSQNFTVTAFDDGVGAAVPNYSQFRVMGYLINSGIYTATSVTLTSALSARIEQISR